MAFKRRTERSRSDNDSEGVESDDPMAAILAREGLDPDEVARRLNRDSGGRRTSPEALIEAARRIA